MPSNRRQRNNPAHFEDTAEMVVAQTEARAPLPDYRSHPPAPGAEAAPATALKSTGPAEGLPAKNLKKA